MALAKHTSAFTKGQWVRPILKLQISDTNLYSDQCSNTAMMCAQEWPSKNLVLFYYFLYYYSLQNAVRTSSCCLPTTQELLKTNGHVVMGKIKEPKAARKHLWLEKGRMHRIMLVCELICMRIRLYQWEKKDNFNNNLAGAWSGETISPTHRKKKNKYPMGTCVYCY